MSDGHELAVTYLEQQIAKLTEDNRVLREALEFYGAHETYERIDLPLSFVRAIKERDAGAKAREVLAKIEEDK